MIASGMTDTPQKAAARKLRDEIEKFQLRAVRFSHASEEELEHTAQLYSNAEKSLQKALQGYREAIHDST